MLTWKQKRQIKKSLKQVKKRVNSKEFKEQLRQSIASMEPEQVLDALRKMTGAIKQFNEFSAQLNKEWDENFKDKD